MHVKKIVGKRSDVYGTPHVWLPVNEDDLNEIVLSEHMNPGTSREGGYGTFKLDDGTVVHDTDKHTTFEYSGHTKRIYK